MASFTNWTTKEPVKKETTANNGGFLGGLGYLGEKIGYGAVQAVEGIWDFLAGGVADIFGADDWAKEQMESTWLDYDAPDKYFNPDGGWKIAGDIASGLGNVLPTIALAAVTAGAGAGAGVVAAVGGATAGTSAAGGATREAYLETGDLTGDEWMYGVMVGTTEGLLEAATTGIGTGVGAITKAVRPTTKAATSAARSGLGSLLGKTAKHIGKEFISEGVEEGLAEVAAPYYARATYDPNKPNATAEDVAYATIVGGITGVILGGAGATVNKVSTAISDTRAGTKAMENGYAAEVLASAKAVAEAEAKSPSGYDLLATIAETYNKVGDNPTKQQLGALFKQTSVARVLPQVDSALVQILADIPSAVTKYNATTGESITAADLTANLPDGYMDKVNAATTTEARREVMREMRQAASKNDKLLRLAVASATGNMMVDAKAMADYTEAGKLPTREEYEILAEDPNKRRAIEVLMGVNDLSAVSYESFREKLTQYASTNGQEIAKARADKAKMAAIPENTAEIPADISTLADGAHRFGGYGIIKSGSSVQIYDYDTGRLSRPLTMEEAKAFFNKPAEATDVEGWSEQNIVGYKELTGKEKRSVRLTVLQARSLGISAADISVQVSVMARSGVRIEYTTTPEGVNGYYDPEKNVIVIDPKKKQPATKTLMHELSHTLYKDMPKFQKALDRASRKLDKVKADKVEERYGKDVATEEKGAYYAEDVLGNTATLARLTREEPTLGEKVLGFFKLAKTDYMGNARLSRAAGTLYTRFEEAFKAFSSANRLRLGVETVASGGARYSYAGENAATSDKSMLAMAQKMLADGKGSEEIRRTTGWFKGLDGKWRYEIDDSEMRVTVPQGKYPSVGDFVEHEKLFAAYPELAGMFVTIHDINGKLGSYSRTFGDIQLSADLVSDPEKLREVLVHELQHAVQDIEGFASGATVEAWERKIADGYDSRSKYIKAEESALQERLDHYIREDEQNGTSFVEDMRNLREMTPDHPRGAIDWETLEKIEEDSPEWQAYDKEYERLSGKYGDKVFAFVSMDTRLDELRSKGGRSAMELYLDTAGEIEARDVVKRINLTAEERKNTRPDIDREDVVFAEGAHTEYVPSSAYDPETAGIRDQVIQSQQVLDQMEPVYSGTVPAAFSDKASAKTWAVEQLRKTGYAVDRQGFGSIEFGKNEIYGAIEHLNNPSEFGAIIALPRVLKRGIQIGEHGNHKNREKHTITLAAPVVLNGVRGNMAAVVNYVSHKFYMHRILLPDGSAIKFDETKNAYQEMHKGVPKGSLAGATRYASITIVADQIGKVNPSGKKFSVDLDSEYLSAVERGDTETEQRIVDEAAEEAMPKSKMRTEDGRLRKLYHGTNTGGFTVFNPDYIGMSSGDDGFFGMGFYFAYSRGEASYYGAKRIITAYLNLENPFNFDTELRRYRGERARAGRAPSAVALMNFAEKFPDIASGVTLDVMERGADTGKSITIEEFSRGFKEVIDNKKFEYSEITNEFGEKETLVLADPTEFEYEYNGAQHKYTDYGFQRRYLSKPNVLDVAYDYLSESVYRYIDMPNFTRVILDNNRAFTDALKKAGYDGAIQSEHGDEAVAFYPYQIKSADPVTYDDNGNIILPSERFNTKKSDIRYSVDLDAPAPTSGQMAKARAEARLGKVFEKKEVETIVSALDGVGDLKKATVEDITDRVWEAFNKATGKIDTAERVEAASLALADYILEQVAEKARVENPAYEEARKIVEYCKAGIGKLVNLTESEKAELQHKYDKGGRKSFFGRWGNKTQGEGISLGQFVQGFVADTGMEYLGDMAPVEAMMAIAEMYEAATGVEETVSKYADISEEELAEMRRGISEDLQTAFADGGRDSKALTIKKRVSDTANEHLERLRQTSNDYLARLRQVASRNRIHKKLVTLNGIATGEFAKDTQGLGKTFKGSISELAKMEWRGTLNDTSVRTQFARLAAWYADDKNAVINMGEPKGGFYLEEVNDILREIGGKENLPLSNDELVMVEDIVNYFTKFVRDYGKVWNEVTGQYEELRKSAEQMHAVMGEAKQFNGKADGKLVRTMLDNYRTTFFDPMSVLRMRDGYEDGFYTKVGEMLRRGSIDAQVDAMRVRKPIEAFLAEHKGYLEQAHSEKLSFRDKNVSRMNLISLYMSLSRKHSWKGFATQGVHILAEDGNNIDIRGNSELKTEEEWESAAKTAQDDIARLLTTDDMAYIKLLEENYNGELKQMKARRDFQRRGFSNISDDYYYPIRRYMARGSSLDDSSVEAELDRISKSSFNQSIVAGAAQPLVIEGADIVFERHLIGVTSYLHLQPAIDYYNAVYNYKPGNIAQNSIAHLESTYWADGKRYMQDLFRSVQRGGTATTLADSYARKAVSALRSGYATSALAANPKVWFTQLASFASASSMLDADSLAKGLAQDTSEVYKYCPLAELRAYDNTAVLAQTNTESKLYKVGKQRSKIVETLMAPISKMDALVIRKEFGACQVQVEKDGGPKVGTEENKIAAGKLLERVILETQQNALATERSAAMRSNSEFLRSVTMFTSDAMKNIGRVIDGYGEVKILKAKIKAETDAKKKAALTERMKAAKKKLRRASMALATSSAYMVAVAQLFRFLLAKDEDDENPMLSAIVDFFGNMLGGLPLISDAYGLLFEGYEMDDYTYSMVNDILTSGKAIITLAVDAVNGEASSQDVARAVKNLAMAGAQMFGIPFRNIYNNLYGITKRISPTAGYAIDSVFYEKNVDGDLAKALKKGDQTMVAYLLGLSLDERVGGYDSAVYDEILTVISAGETVTAKKVPKTITVDGEEIELTKEQQGAIAAEYAKQQSALTSLVKSGVFSNLTNGQKAESINLAYKIAYNISQWKAVDTEPTSATVIASVVGADKVALVSTLTAGIEADLDKKGEKIAGSRRKKIIKEINKLDLTPEEKMLLIIAKGYAIQDGDIRGMSAEQAKARLKKYIVKHKGLNKAQKEMLAERCGFEVKNGAIK